MSRLNAPSPAAVKRGEGLMAFLRERKIIATRRDLAEYLDLRCVKRYRVVEVLGSGDVRIYLPARKLEALSDVAPYKPVGYRWQVFLLPWWRIGRSFATEQPEYTV